MLRGCEPVRCNVLMHLVQAEGQVIATVGMVRAATLNCASTGEHPQMALGRFKGLAYFAAWVLSLESEHCKHVSLRFLCGDAVGGRITVKG